MLFNSLTYVLYLPVVVAITWALPGRFRPAFLLAASYIFYADWNPPFLLLVVFMTVVNYCLGASQGRQAARSRILMVAAVAFNLIVLGVFKYLGFLDSSASSFAHAFGLPVSLPVVRLILPLGLSFFTFEFIHYQIDVYRGSSPIRSPIEFALFPAFFPTQIAGPIKRYQNFEAQVQAHPSFDARTFLEGLELIAAGMFKKIVLSDSLLPIVSGVFASSSPVGTVDSWIGAAAFSFQIYLDFSGYTDIGRGSAQLLGYTVPVNFRAPYLATSLRDFWRRWHISLSSWLRDYLYIPLGGNRKGRWRTEVNVMVTMALGGLWHGAAWHFLVWGIGHGAGLVMNRWTQVWTRLDANLPRTALTVAAWAVTQIFVLVMWVPFRSVSTGASISLWRQMAGLSSGPAVLTMGDRLTVLGIGVGVLMVEFALQRVDLRRLIRSSPVSTALRPAYVATLALAAIQFASINGVVHRFIYFQF